MTDPVDGKTPDAGAEGKKRPWNRRRRRRQNGQNGHFGKKQATNLTQNPSHQGDQSTQTGFKKGEMHSQMRPSNEIQRDKHHAQSSTKHKSNLNGNDLAAPAQNDRQNRHRHHDGAQHNDVSSPPMRHGSHESERNSSTYKKAPYKKPYYKQSYRHKQNRYKSRSSSPLYGALDLGTNNCRLLIAHPLNRGKFRVVDAYSRIVRLGEGMTTTGRIGENAMSRAIEALNACRKKLEFREVKRHRLIATQACRMAENCDEFLTRVRNEAGIELEIVDQKTEARLAVSGCGSLVDRSADGVVVFDIGGGSSELALLDTKNFRARKIADHITAWTSLPLGVVTLSERHGGHEITKEVFQSMIDEVADHLLQFKERHALDSAQRSGKFHLLGTSGTVTTLAGVHLNLQRYDRRMVDGIWLDDSQIDDMVQRIMDMGFQGRVDNPCIGDERADLVLAGCAILQAIRAVWPSERLRVADRGLREGILTELMYQDGVWRRHSHSSYSHKS